MAITNSLANRNTDSNTLTYKVGNDEIKLTLATVKNYLVSGNAEHVTQQELVTYMNLCRYQGLNPWVKECYLIKYGNNPATMVISKEAFQKRAEANPNYDGMASGIIVGSQNGFEYRNGALALPGEDIVGGWAEVFRKDRKHPCRVEISFEEYAGRTKDGRLNSQWASKPATMIRKVAIAQALRESFPAALGGLFTEEEQNVIIPQEETIRPQDIPEDAVVEQAPPVPQEVEEGTQQTVESILFGEQ
jgi:phage recombination protein Bet